MESAYILINTETGKEYEVYNAVKEMKGAVEVQIVYGLYDIVMKVESPDSDGIRELIKVIRDLKDIKSTLTLIAV